MADLTSILTITGTVGDKTFNYTHTYTPATVIDVVDQDDEQMRDAEETALVMSGSTDVASNSRSDKANPDHLYVQHRGKKGRAFVKLYQETGAKSAALVLKPGQWMEVHKGAAGGSFNSSTTAITTTYLDMDAVLITGKGTQEDTRLMAHFK